jgi:hypothetical protein
MRPKERFLRRERMRHLSARDELRCALGYLYGRRGRRSAASRRRRLQRLRPPIGVELLYELQAGLGQLSGEWMLWRVVV